MECLEGIKKFNGPSIQLPDNGMIEADRKGIIPLSDELSPEAKTAMILPNLRSASLISMGQLCDDGCDVLFNAQRLIVIKNEKIVLQGMRNRRDNLWDIPIQKRKISPPNYQLPALRHAIYRKKDPIVSTKLVLKNIKPKAQQANSSINILKNELQEYMDLTDDNILDSHLETMKKEQLTPYCKVNLHPTNPSLAVIIKKKQTHTELVQYMHATCFAPVKSTFESAIKQNFFSTWPGLTPELVRKHLTTSTPTTQGHLHQEKQHLQTTKISPHNTAPMQKIQEYFKNYKQR